MDILVVDDEPLILEACRRVLSKEGHRITLVGGTREALAALEKARYHLVIADLKMPETDGLHLIEVARKRWPHLPILAMSGYPTRDTVSSSLASGADNFIAKPWTPAEFLEAVRKLLPAES